MKGRESLTRQLGGNYVGSRNEEAVAGLKIQVQSLHSTGFLGVFHDQHFFSLRAHDVAHVKSLPFEEQAFSALIEAPLRLTDQQISDLAHLLLSHGMTYALCVGERADALRQRIDELVDDQSLEHDGYTVYSDVFDQDFEAALDYFVLPTGLTQTSLILCMNEDHGFDSDGNQSNGQGLGSAQAMSEDEELVEWDEDEDEILWCIGEELCCC